jgi:anion-transporting  ArsA/GET3 family ATPase
VVTGKGGVGKTTVATALGLVAARRGRRTIVAEVAHRSDVARALGVQEHGGEAEIAPGLHHVSVDPETAMEEYLAAQLPSRAAVELLRHSKVFTYLAAATPGLRELLTVGKVWDLAQQERRTKPSPDHPVYDLVVLDAPATGHGIAMLRAPATFAQAAQVGRIARQARTIDAMLSDPARTAVVAVARAEELPVTEALDLELTLRERTGLELDLVVCNAVRPRRLTGAEADTLRALPPSRPVRAALAGHERARLEAAQLARLRRGTAAPVVTLPWSAGEPDPDALSRVLERGL